MGDHTNRAGVGNKKRWKLKHLDVKVAYLNDTLTEEVFMAQPQGFVEPRHEQLVCRLRKML